MDLIYPTWEDVERLCERLAQKAGGYRADVLVGISRGGLVPVRLLSDCLGNANIAIMKIELYKGIGERKEKAEITQPITADIKGKKVLIVDDVADTGRSLITAKEYCEKQGAREIRFATLHFKPGSKIRPDYFVEQTEAWIVYPWEKKEAKAQLERMSG